MNRDQWHAKRNCRRQIRALTEHPELPTRPIGPRIPAITLAIKNPCTPRIKEIQNASLC
jgi:hypothetical protein